jgi:hypothetical protein
MPSPVAFLREVPVGPDRGVGPGRQLDLMDPVDLLDDTSSTGANPTPAAHGTSAKRHPRTGSRTHAPRPQYIPDSASSNGSNGSNGSNPALAERSEPKARDVARVFAPREAS